MWIPILICQGRGIDIFPAICYACPEAVHNQLSSFYLPLWMCQRGEHWKYLNIFVGILVKSDGIEGETASAGTALLSVLSTQIIWCFQISPNSSGNALECGVGQSTIGLSWLLRLSLGGMEWNGEKRWQGVSGKWTFIIEFHKLSFIKSSAWLNSPTFTSLEGTSFLQPTKCVFSCRNEIIKKKVSRIYGERWQKWMAKEDLREIKGLSGNWHQT